MKFLSIIIGVPLAVLGQDAWQPPAPAPDQTTSQTSDPMTIADKWANFDHETIAPFTLAAGAFNAAVSQVTRSAPLYGRHWSAYPKRFAASVGDIVSQNFFADVLLASAFHEDPRYHRKGPSRRLWPRIGYAISRSIVTRADSGDSTFNWSNVLGTAMSAGLSNAYYPSVSRTVAASATNWGTSMVGTGLVNLLPEFLPDFKAWVKRKIKK